MISEDKYVSRWIAQKEIGCTNTEFQQLLDSGTLDYIEVGKGSILILARSLRNYLSRGIKDQESISLKRKLALLEERVSKLEALIRKQEKRITELLRQKPKEEVHSPEKEDAPVKCRLSDYPLISESNLSVRAKNVLKKNKIDTVEKLSSFSRQELRLIRGCGRQTVKELIEFLQGYRIYLLRKTQTD